MGRLRDALARPGLSWIAEIKRRSPSAGDLRPDAEPAELAAGFERAGASVISVLVDERFAGTVGDLTAARSATGVPLLAKGFFSQESELSELRAAGADAVLLLLRNLDDARVQALMTAGAELGLDALVEAHDAEELRRANALGADPIGVNARDLSTFNIDRSAQLDLVAQAPRDRIIVAESAISTRAHGAAAELAGADAVLVGSALMRAPDPPGRLSELRSRPLVKVCGFTRQEDVDVAVEAGADLCGFIFADSPRRASRVLDVPDGVLSVAVYVGEAGDDGADLVQVYERAEGKVRGRDGVLLRGDERVVRVIDLPWDEADARHLERAAAVANESRIMLAGRLDSSNVGAAIERVRPWAVDAASRLESSPGVKDPAAVRAYVQAARC